jgi:hypothetical protein
MKMAKLKREVVGSFLKAKDEGKAPYIKIKNAVAFKEGDIIRVENKKFQLASLESAIEAGKLGGENAEKARERINKIPDFVLGELVVLREA